jgi:hypothetical protein
MMRKFHEAGKWKCSVTFGEAEHHERISFLRYGTSSGICIRKHATDYLYNVGTGEDLTIKQLAETIKNNRTQRRNHLG